MLRLDADTLCRPTQEVSRLLALQYLDEALRAARKMTRRADTEALHDFRVGLRRLRSLERAYRPFLTDSVRKKLRIRLRRSAQETGEARDAEVQLAWIRSQARRARGRAAIGLQWVVQRLEARVASCGSRRTKEGSREFKRLAALLKRRLSFYRLRVRRNRASIPPQFKQTSASLLKKHCAVLRLDLLRLPTVDGGALHAARISTKRLRYLFEPLAPLAEIGEGGAACLESLRALQELLGKIHDLHVLGPLLAAEQEASRIELPAAEVGITRLLELASSEEALLRSELLTGWLSGQAGALLESIERHAKMLSRA